MGSLAPSGTSSLIQCCQIDFFQFSDFLAFSRFFKNSKHLCQIETITKLQFFRNGTLFVIVGKTDFSDAELWALKVCMKNWIPYLMGLKEILDSNPKSMQLEFYTHLWITLRGITVFKPVLPTLSFWKLQNTAKLKIAQFLFYFTILPQK